MNTEANQSVKNPRIIDFGFRKALDGGKYAGQSLRSWSSS